MKQLKRIRNCLYGMAGLVFLIGFLLLFEAYHEGSVVGYLGIPLVYLLPLLGLFTLFQLAVLAYFKLNHRSLNIPSKRMAVTTMAPAFIALVLALGFFSGSVYWSNEVYCPHVMHGHCGHLL